MGKQSPHKSRSGLQARKTLKIEAKAKAKGGSKKREEFNKKISLPAASLQVSVCEALAHA